MFVKNLTSDVLTLRKSGKVLKLKPGMNCVNGFWTMDFIKSVYGPQYVVFFADETVEEKTEEVTEETVEEVTEETVEEVTEETVVEEEKTEEVVEEVKEEVTEETVEEVTEETVEEVTEETVEEEAPKAKTAKTTAKNAKKNK